MCKWYIKAGIILGSVTYIFYCFCSRSRTFNLFYCIFQQILCSESLLRDALQRLNSEEVQLADTHGRASVELLCLLSTDSKVRVIIFIYA